MKKRLNILFTVAWYPNRMQPGDGVFVEKHAKSLAVNHDVNVLMVKTDPSVDSTFQIDKEIDESGNLRIYRVYVPKVKKEVPVYTQLKRFYHYLRGSLAGYQMILKDSGRPDISHINVLTRAGLLPYILKKKYNIPYIITEHWSRYERNDFPGSCIQHYLTKKIVASASFVAPVSMNLQKAMIGKGLINDNYVIVNNVVDTDVFVCKNGEEDSYSVIKKDILYSKQGDASSSIEKENVSSDQQENKITICHLSWMRNESKNISGIIETINELRKIRTDFVLKMIGDGIDRRELEKMSIDLGLSDYIRFVGVRSGADLAAELRSSDFFLLFSNFENQPVCILESLSSGIPVVATRVGALEDMVGDERGILVDPKDKEALLAAIIKMMDSYKDYDSTALHKYIEDNFSPKAVAEAYERLYFKSL